VGWSQGIKSIQGFLLSFHQARTTLKLELSELNLSNMPDIGHLEGLTSVVMLRYSLVYPPWRNPENS
jgi:hypothetical protein